MAKPFNGVLPINESNKDKALYQRLYNERKELCRLFHKQSKLHCTRVLDDGRAARVVQFKPIHHKDGGNLWVDTLDYVGGDDFFDFLSQ